MCVHRRRSQESGRLRHRALFGVCLYAACRINEACTLTVKDVFGSNGVRGVLVLRSVNTKGKRDTREIQVHPKLREYLERLFFSFLASSDARFRMIRLITHFSLMPTK
ncbi:MAG: hypothetical protein RMX97_32695 [Nostoc sp. DedQUE11]|nr:hypothetical protein [Nostoc sp. DedQUE11]